MVRNKNKSEPFCLQNNLGLANKLRINSSHHLLSEVSSKVEINGMWPVDTNANMDLEVVSDNHTFKVNTPT